MKNLKTNQKGVTLITLVITIIIMFILAAVTIEVGTEDVDFSKRMSFLAYMQTIQTKVDMIAQNEDYLNYGEALSSNNKSKLQAILNSGNESFITKINSSYLRYFDSNHISSDLGVDNIDDEIVVDFNTREVISLNGVKYENKKYYTQYYLPGGQTLEQQTEEISRTVSIGEIVSNIDGLNAVFIIKDVSIYNGTLSYGQKDESGVIKWTTITNSTKKGEKVLTNNITETGVYYFKLVDNVSGKDNVDSEGNYPSVELKLTNLPKLEGKLTDLSISYNYSDINKSENWAYATDKTDSANLLYYVWIPRFAYKVDSEGNVVKDENGKVILEFLRGTSDITTRSTYINSTEWIEPTAFTEGTNKRTGVWLQVDTPNKTRCGYNR